MKHCSCPHVQYNNVSAHLAYVFQGNKEMCCIIRTAALYTGLCWHNLYNGFLFFATLIQKMVVGWCTWIYEYNYFFQCDIFEGPCSSTSTLAWPLAAVTGERNRMGKVGHVFIFHSPLLSLATTFFSPFLKLTLWLGSQYFTLSNRMFELSFFCTPSLSHTCTYGN